MIIVPVALQLQSKTLRRFAQFVANACELNLCQSEIDGKPTSVACGGIGGRQCALALRFPSLYPGLASGDPLVVRRELRANSYHLRRLAGARTGQPLTGAE